MEQEQSRHFYHKLADKVEVSRRGMTGFTVKESSSASPYRVTFSFKDFPLNEYEHNLKIL